MAWFDGFESLSFEVNGASIHARCSKRVLGEPRRPALLLLHGSQQSHVMWHRVAKRLSQDYFLVMSDLSGYGDLSKTEGLPDDSNDSKRNMAHDMVAHLLALDMYQGNSMTEPFMEFAKAYYHWFHMLQPAPLPEIMMGANHPETAWAYLHAKLGGWGSIGPNHIEPRALAE